MKRIVDVNYEYPSEVSSKAKSFIDKILKKNPDDRFDIDEVLKDKFLQWWFDHLYYKINKSI